MTAHVPVSPVGLDPVETLCFWETDEVKVQRRRLLSIRNHAAKRAYGTAGACRDLFWIINDVAGQCCFAPMSAEELKDVADTLTRLGLGANGLWRIEGARDDS